MVQRSLALLALLVNTAVGLVGNNLRFAGDSASLGSGGLCVIGCTPYVDPTMESHGILKYKALVEDMANNCDVLVHIGDTKPGSMACNGTLITNSVHILKDAAAAKGKLALYTPGDNEINDCHRHGSLEVPSEIYTAEHARQHLIADMNLNQPRDLTGRYRVINHNVMNRKFTDASNQTYNCAFDKYVELDNYAIATLEILGSDWYLANETKDYPRQDEFDSFSSRLPLYINARDCALDWIHRSAIRASRSNKRALFFLFHANFYQDGGKEAKRGGSLIDNTVARPYQPLFKKLTETAKRHPDLMFYVVHSDSHRFSTIRMNPTLDNRDLEDDRLYYSHHNLMAHQVDGSSRALTMFSRFKVDDDFQPVTQKQVWSKSAYNEVPKGHSYVPYIG